MPAARRRPAASATRPTAVANVAVPSSVRIQTRSPYDAAARVSASAIVSATTQRPGLAELALEERHRAVESGLRCIGVVGAEGVLLVRERMPGAGVDDELHVLAHVLELLLQVLHWTGWEEVVVLGVVALHRGSEPTPVRCHVAERRAVEGRRDGDLVALQRGDQQGQHAAHAEPDHPDLVAADRIMSEQVV